MSGFRADWLALRRPADEAARNPVVLGLVAGDLAETETVRIADLGAGTGSTFALLSGRLPKPQAWRLYDNDPALLAIAAKCAPAGGTDTLSTHVLDLATSVERVLEAPTDLVTCSALLDLTSAAWIDRLVGQLTSAGVPFYAALSYDGHMSAVPPHPLDEIIVDLFNQHQRSDKGFGEALGPSAHAYATAQFRTAGWEVTEGRSDWHLDEDDRDLMRALVDGHVQAVAETGAVSVEDLASWSMVHEVAIEAGEARIVVGHRDLYARPSRPR